MKKMPIKMMFLLTLMLSTIITMTANSWLAVWMGLEMNLMSFIPLISSQPMLNHKLSSIKYFIIQAISSITLLMTFIITMMNFIYTNMNIMIMIMMMSLLMKMGAAPLHFWFPEVMEFLSWDNCILLMTWQKVAPMTAISYIDLNNNMMVIFIISSSIIGAIMGLNQISLRMILSYSSINHIGWMLSSLQSNMITWTYYMMVYSLLSTLISLLFKSYNLNSINELFMINNQNKLYKLNMMMSMMSLGGMPPFLGFLPKWILIQEMMMNSSYMITMILVMSSIITLYFYLKLFMSAGLMYFKENKWNKNFNLKKMNMISLYLNMMSSMGLIMSPLLM
uniref:NADH-ubiquinone oxidoreductase chain 2 n=1 Tax=Teredorus hainanensis TaxID=2936564 RepID=A0A8T9VSP2_9ORTH|nr:NADH dehydrogenase subunit 2 [Teredorus hainanensis]UPH84291.1 NADH dehydrogenase subunit 2 [Teredorus hainanensis]